MSYRRSIRRAPSLWIALALATAGAMVSTLSACEPGGGQATKVFDGDSFLMRDPGGKEIEVRLYAIDAPERSQPWSRRSRESLRRLIRGYDLSLELVDTDRYGRAVAKVTRQMDGLVINKEMIRRGDAWVYRRYASDPDSLSRLGRQDLFELEEAARNQSLGLWSLPKAEQMAPWEWRKQQRVRATR